MIITLKGGEKGDDFFLYKFKICEYKRQLYANI